MAVYDFTINQGSDSTLEISFKDESGTEQSLYGYSAAMQIRRTPQSAPMDTLTTANGRITLSQDNKKLILSFPHSATSQYTVETSVCGVNPYVRFDLELTSANQEVTRVLQGRITISQEITRV